MKNSILTIALASKFTTEQVNSILEVVHATNNPDVAIEILLGIYEEPKLPMEPVNPRKFDSTKRNMLLTSYDKFSEQVSYQYYTMKTKFGWIEKGVTVDLANIVSTRRYSEDAAAELKLTPDAFKSTHDFHTFDDELEVDSDGDIRLYNSSCEYYMWLNMDKPRRY